MKLLTILFFLMIITGNTFSQTAPPVETGVSQALARWRAANYSDVRYKLNITLEKGAPLMKGEIEISVNLTGDGAKNDLILDWRTTQLANDEEKPYAAVNGINDSAIGQSSGSRKYSFEEKEHLIISKSLLKTGENKILIQFASPVKTSGGAVTRYVDKEDGAEYIYSLFVPSDASTAFPVFDQPDLKAKFSLNITAPVDWKVVSNGRKICTNEGRVIESEEQNEAFREKRRKEFEKRKAEDPNFNSDFAKCAYEVPLNGNTFTSFSETKPISTYVFAFAAGDFAEFTEKDADEAVTGSAKEGRTAKGVKTANGKTAVAGSEAFVSDDAVREKTGTHIFVRKSQAGKFKAHEKEVFRLNREGVKFLENYFDYKFPFPKYDLVLIPEFPFNGMEHAGATFIRETSVIFPTEPTKNDYVSRANVMFHEAAHQWFGDTVTMKWFDDLWLKEGFAEFMAYKTLEKVMPEYNAWKIFYERNKQAAYLTDATRGTTPIYQEIANLSAAKSAYGNIVYRKAPSFLKQAEFYLGADKFQIAVRAFLKKHEFANAEWTDLVKEFERASGENLDDFGDFWVKRRGVSVIIGIGGCKKNKNRDESISCAQTTTGSIFFDENQIISSVGTPVKKSDFPQMKMNVLFRFTNGATRVVKVRLGDDISASDSKTLENFAADKSTGQPDLIFPNYQDYGYGTFLLDDKSRAYVLENIQNEKDDFLRAMMWGSLWDAVREGELDPKDYIELVIKNLDLSAGKRMPTSVKPLPDGKPPTFPETDVSTLSTLLGRVGTAMNYYVSEEQRKKIAPRIETVLRQNMMSWFTPEGERITVFRAYLNLASTEESRLMLKSILKVSRLKAAKPELKNSRDLIDIPPLRTKDHFDIVTRLLILGDEDAPELLAELEKTETSDEAERYAYAAKAGIFSAENKAKFWTDFVSDREISESWIESAFVSFNSPRHAELTLPYLEKALTELPNLKRNRKIFFVNGWLSAFIGGQKSEEALNIVNEFLRKNPNLDKDLRLKILENADVLERAVKIRRKFAVK